MIALRALGALLTYPRPELLAALDEIGAAIAGADLLRRADKARLAALVAELAAGEPLELEERYVALFERGRARSLHLFEHVHGEARERGQAMVDLAQLYARAGFALATNELPDYLPAVLEYLSCRPRAEARDLLGDCAHVLRAVGERLAASGSHYAAVFEALLALAGERGLDWSKAAEPEPHPDEEWMDAPAFAPGPERGAPAVAPVRFVPRKQG
ncbi:MAG: nitrate reductase molybdenum cofactor assembly chaperone [Burkholderiales bacterium]